MVPRHRLPELEAETAGEVTMSEGVLVAMRFIEAKLHTLLSKDRAGTLDMPNLRWEIEQRIKLRNDLMCRLSENVIRSKGVRHMNRFGELEDANS